MLRATRAGETIIGRYSEVISIMLSFSSHVFLCFGDGPKRPPKSGGRAFPTFNPSFPSYGHFCRNMSRPHPRAPLAEIEYAPLGSDPGLGSTSPVVAAGPNRKRGGTLCSLLVCTTRPLVAFTRRMRTGRFRVGVAWHGRTSTLYGCARHVAVWLAIFRIGLFVRGL
jgi:hypothetical protein